MKKSKLIELHLYCGLFTSFYILAFGVSSLILNHDLKVENTKIKHRYETQASIDPKLEDDKLAESIRDQLGIMGWLPRWQMQRDSQAFNFTVVHLAKTTELKVDLLSGRTEVAEIPKGFLATLHGLHFFNGKIPNGPFFLKVWVVYQWLSLFILFVSLILGLWLWIKYSYKSWEIYFFGFLFILSVALMVLI